MTRETLGSTWVVSVGQRCRQGDRRRLALIVGALRHGGRRRRLRLARPPDRMQDSPARVLLIAPPGSYRVHAYLEAARDLGIGMLVASEGRALAGPRHRMTGSGSTSATPTPSSSGSSPRIATGPSPGVVATDDGTVEIANRAAAAPSGSRTMRRPRPGAPAARTLPAPRSRRPGCPSPRFGGWSRAVPLGSQLAGVEFPCVVKPLALSGEPRRDPRRRPSGPRSRVPARAGAIARAAAVASAGTEERERAARRVVRAGPEIALEGMPRGRQALGARHLRQTGSARRSVLRRRRST